MQYSSYKRRNFGGPRPVGRRLQYTMLPAVSISSARAPLASRGFRGRYGSKRGELKLFETLVGLGDVPTLGAVVSTLFLPQLGSDYTNRIGRKVVVKSIGFRAYSCLSASQQNAANLGANANVFARGQTQRVMLVYDSQPNGVTSNPADILTSQTTLAMNNLNNRDRYRVIWDKVLTFDPYHVVTDATPVITDATFNRAGQYWTMWKKCNRETIFQANGGTIADVATGAYLLLMVASETTTAFVGNSIRYQIRFRFEDM